MYLFLHVETGGLTPEFSLLELGALAVDESGKEVSRLYLKTKPDGKDPAYTITPRALEFNKIDPIVHDKQAIPYNKAEYVLYEYLEELYRLNSYRKLTVVGWSLSFTMPFIHAYLFPRDSWIQYTNLRAIDLYSMCALATIQGKAPKVSSLHDLNKILPEEIEDDNTAIRDCKVFHSLFEYLKGL